MFYRHKLKNGQIASFRLAVRGEKIIVSTKVKGKVLTATYREASKKFDPGEIVEKFLQERARY